MSFLKALFGWTYNHFISFLIIVAVLAFGKAVINEFKIIHSQEANIHILKEAETEVRSIADSLRRESIDRINSLKEATETTLDDRLRAIDREISNQKKSQCNSLKRITDIKKCLVKNAESEIRIAILEQERPLIVLLRENAKKISRMAKNQSDIEGEKAKKAICGSELKPLEDKSNSDLLLLETNREAQRQLKEEEGNNCKKPWKDCYEDLEELKKEEDRLSKAYAQSSQSTQTKRKRCDDIMIPVFVPQVLSDIEIKIELEIIKVLGPLRDKVSEIEVDLNTNWWKKLHKAIGAVIPNAALILASIILMPIVIKLFLYLVIAPVASRRTSHCLIPETSGMIDHFSAAPATIAVNGQHELLIHPGYVLTSPTSVVKDKVWLIDYKYPLSSLASGMYALTRFRYESIGTYGIGPRKNVVAKLAVLAIPEGSSFVLHPRCLIGIVQRRGHPIVITSHWCLGSLHAWLTLQLRYLVFHGPMSLIVEGSGGVLLEEAGQGQNVNQAATIGFSANLAYATTRAGTFPDYLSGKEELFNDSFPSGNGCFIYENMPHFGERSNPIFGRGLKGIVESFLKVFGL